MDQGEILRKLNGLLQEILDDDSIEASRDAAFSDINGWDSLAHIRLLAAVEEEFGVSFDTSEIVGILSVNELVESVDRKIS